jgi:phage terminase Nu1 subunit (DNA packaging protein)
MVKRRKQKPTKKRPTRKKAAKRKPRKRRAPKKRPPKKTRDTRGRFVKPKPKAAAKKPAEAPPGVPTAAKLDAAERNLIRVVRPILEKMQAPDGGALSQRELAVYHRYMEFEQNRRLREALTRCPQEMLVALLGSHRKVIGDYEQAGMPVAERQKTGKRHAFYDLFAILPWIMKRKQAQANAAGDPEADAVRLRKDSAVARMKEIELGEREGRLVSRNEADRDRLAVVQAFASMLERLPVDFRSAFPTTDTKPHAAWLDEWQAAERERLISQGGTG